MKHMAFRKGFLILNTLILLVIFPSHHTVLSDIHRIGSTNFEWKKGCVDCPNLVGFFSDRGMIMGADGRPHLLFGGSIVNHAWYAGGQWEKKIVDTPPGISAQYSLASDSQGFLHGAYVDWQDNSVRYIYQEQDGWQSEIVYSSTTRQFGTSLAVDAAGKVYLAFIDEKDNSLVFALRDTDGWQSEILESNMGNHSWIPNTGIVLNFEGFPLISYTNPANGYLKLAFQDEEGWHFEVIDNQVLTDAYKSLALDSNGFPRISYWDRTNAALKYAYKDSAGWHTQTVHDIDHYDSSVGLYSSLAIDNQGNPHIAYSIYFASPSTDLGYATLTGGEWQTTVLDSSQDEGLQPTIALDSGGFPHIAYYSSSMASYYRDGDLKYAYQDAQGWHFMVAFVGGRVGEYQAMDVDSLGRTHHAYYDSINKTLKYAVWDSGDFQFEVIQTIGSIASGFGVDIGVDSQNRPHVIFIDARNTSNRRFKYAYRDKQRWHIEDLGVNGNQVVQYIIKLDYLDRPHIMFSTNTALGLAPTGLEVRYAFKDSTGWHFPEIPGLGCTQPSMDIDNRACVHATFLCGNILHYVKQTSHEWTSTKPFGVGVTDFFKPYMAVDRSGNPYLAYISSTHHVVYAYPSTPIWTREYLTSLNANYLDIDTNQMGIPQVAYSGNNYESQVYAYRDSNGWNYETLDRANYPGMDTDISIAYGQYPCVSFYDQGLHGVRMSSQKAPLADLIIQSTPTLPKGRGFEFIVSTVAGCNQDQSTTYSWDFGDGTYATGSKVSHVYAQPGAFTLTVEASTVDNSISKSQVISAGYITSLPLVMVGGCAK